MEYPLYAHQKRILAEDKKKCGLFLGTGASKTRIALQLAQGTTLVICPKQQREDRTWQKNAEKFGVKIEMAVISKEDLRKHWTELPRFDTVIIDEVHNNVGVLPDICQRKGVAIPKTSQIFEATYQYLQKFPPERLYLLSATPVPKPMGMWAIAKLLGQNWDFYQFRDVYYKAIKIGQRRIYIPKKDDESKARLASVIQKFGYTGNLNDFFDVPEQTHREIEIELTPEQEKALKNLSETEADLLVRRGKMRTIENGVLYGKQVEYLDTQTDLMKCKTTIFPSKKIEYILERAIEFPKLLIFANYTAQIDEIARVLRKEDYQVFTLTGKTKDRVNLIQNAENASNCIVIAQSSISSGYELPSFPCVIYASKSWRFVDYEQSLGRVLRSNHLKKNLYIHLVVKGCDMDCHRSIMAGQDFQEKLKLNI